MPSPTFRRGPRRGVLAHGNDPSPARRVALRMLVNSQGRQAHSMEWTLESARRSGEVNHRDASLAQEIARGVARQRLWLEHLLDGYLHKPIPGQAFQVRESLLIGIYQAAFLERIPPHTIVDETVRLVRSARTEAGYRSLANAIMRQVVNRTRDDLRPADSVPWPLRFSVPDWLAGEAGQVFRNGEAQEYFAASNQPAPLNLRIVAHPGAEDAVMVERLRGEIVDITHALPEIDRGRFLRDCVVVRGRGIVPDHLPSFRAGLLTAEDEGAQIAGHLAGVAPGMAVLDLCASPGGKTAHLADLAGRRFRRFLATDRGEDKLARLRETLQRLRLHDIVEVADADRLDDGALAGQFDLVIVDAPCSALGTMRRHPEARWRQRVSTIRSLARAQQKLLERAAPLVAPGGILFYSVCTFLKQETDGAIGKFLATHGEAFEPAPAPEGLPFDPERFAAGPGRWRTATHRDGCDSFFVARLRKR